MTEDQEMMLSPDKWPLWPYLPLKRPNPQGGFPFLATLAETGLTGQKFSFKKDDDPEIKTGGHELIEEIVNDGWVVD